MKFENPMISVVRLSQNDVITTSLSKTYYNDASNNDNVIQGFFKN